MVIEMLLSRWLFVTTSEHLIDPIAAAAALVSLCALFVSIWSGCTQRKHNRKSIRAVGCVELDNSQQLLQVRIFNKGCGPMMIKELTAEGGGNIHHNLAHHLLTGFPEPREITGLVSFQIHTKPEGYWLLPGGELVLLRFEGKDTEQAFAAARDSIRSVLCGITVKLTFRDVYDKDYPTVVKSLDWFGSKLHA